jgi:putative tricarboxylic transport membrane protein
VERLEIIAPAGPGGGYDQLARATQEVLQAQGLAADVQVQNIPGAGGTIGLAQFVTKRTRDPGLLVAGLGMVGAIHVNKSPVTLDQVTPLARLTGEYQPLVVAAGSPIRTLDDLIAKFRVDPGSVSWGGFALGSPDHLLCAMVVKAAGGDVSDMNYIVAGAGGEMLAQAMGGHITVATGGLNEMAQQLRTGTLRALGISSPERLPGVDIPTFKEQGLDVELVNWRGLMAPGTVRAGDLEAMDAAMRGMVESVEWQAIAKERGWVDMYLPSAEFATFLAGEQTRIAGILEDLGLVQ